MYYYKIIIIINMMMANIYYLLCERQYKCLTHINSLNSLQQLSEFGIIMKTHFIDEETEVYFYYINNWSKVAEHQSHLSHTGSPISRVHSLPH